MVGFVSFTVPYGPQCGSEVVLRVLFCIVVGVYDRIPVVVVVVVAASQRTQAVVPRHFEALKRIFHDFIFTEHCEIQNGTVGKTQNFLATTNVYVTLGPKKICGFHFYGRR